MTYDVSLTHHLPQPVGPKQLPVVRRMLAEDIQPLISGVGPLVDTLYERGAEKLLRRLEAARDGYASAHVVSRSPWGPPLGLAAEVGKGAGAQKLSTFWIAPNARSGGLGSLLLDHRIDSWIRSDMSRAYVTVRASRAAELERLFVPRGFRRVALDRGRYGELGDEVVLEWVPGSITTYSVAA